MKKHLISFIKRKMCADEYLCFLLSLSLNLSRKRFNIIEYKLSESSLCTLIITVLCRITAKYHVDLRPSKCQHCHKDNLVNFFKLIYT